MKGNKHSSLQSSFFNLPNLKEIDIPQESHKMPMSGEYTVSYTQQGIGQEKLYLAPCSPTALAFLPSWQDLGLLLQSEFLLSLFAKHCSVHRSDINMLLHIKKITVLKRPLKPKDRTTLVEVRETWWIWYCPEVPTHIALLLCAIIFLHWIQSLIFVCCTEVITVTYTNLNCNLRWELSNSGMTFFWEQQICSVLQYNVV